MVLSTGTDAAPSVVTAGFTLSLGNKVGLYTATPVVQPSAITKPTGGATIDAEARTAIDLIIDALGAAGGGIGVTA